MLWSDLLLSQPFKLCSLWGAIKDCWGLAQQDKHHTSAHSSPLPNPDGMSDRLGESESGLR